MKCPVCHLSEAVVYIDEEEYGCIKCGVAFTSIGVVIDEDWSLDEKSPLQVFG